MYACSVSFEVQDFEGVHAGHAHVRCFPKMKGRKVSKSFFFYIGTNILQTKNATRHFLWTK